MKHAIRHIHFVGIGGAGMSGIAEVLLNLGYQISGSDLNDSATLRRLASLGIRTQVGHAAAHVAEGQGQGDEDQAGAFTGAEAVGEDDGEDRHAGDQRHHGVEDDHGAGGADQVDHHRRRAHHRLRQRQAKDGAQVIFELARLGALDCPVARVVNPWGHLVGQQFYRFFSHSF